jgi:hypothetical protein
MSFLFLVHAVGMGAGTASEAPAETGIGLTSSQLGLTDLSLFG